MHKYALMLFALALVVIGVACAPTNTAVTLTPAPEAPIIWTPSSDEGAPAADSSPEQDTTFRPLNDYEAATAISESSRQLINLDIPTFWPASLSGNEYVMINFEDQELYLVDWATGETTQVTNDGGRKWEAAITQEYIAWTSHEGDVSVHRDGREETLSTHHIYVLDRDTGEQNRITSEPAPRTQLALNGERLVWADKRNEMDSFYTHYDIYAYDLAAGIEIPIAIVPGEQQLPRIHGDLLVWQDNRNSPHLGMPLSGCGNCPENRMDIYLYDFENESQRPLVEDEWLKTNPAIYGRHVAWAAFSEEGQGDIYLMDLDTEQIRRLTQTPDPERSPQLAQGQLLWTISDDCDVINIDAETGQELAYAYGVYLFDMAGETISHVSQFKEARSLLNNQIALVTEGCMTGYDTYAIPLTHANR